MAKDRTKEPGIAIHVPLWAVNEVQNGLGR